MKLEVNIEKKYFFILLGAILILASMLAVYAYNAAGTGGNPSVMGHSADEIEGALGGGGSISFGNYESKSSSTTYQASTDGFVTAYRIADSAVYGRIEGYTDSNANPSTKVADDFYNAAGGHSASITFPVKKGNYWKVVPTHITYTEVRWIPLIGSSDQQNNIMGRSCTLLVETGVEEQILVPIDLPNSCIDSLCTFYLERYDNNGADGGIFNFFFQKSNGYFSCSGAGGGTLNMGSPRLNGDLNFYNILDLGTNLDLWDEKDGCGLSSTQICLEDKRAGYGLRLYVCA